MSALRVLFCCYCQQLVKLLGLLFFALASGGSVAESGKQPAAISAANFVPQAGVPDPAYIEMIQTMRSSQRGPFWRLRWFCNDGEVLPPKPNACREHGGGKQYAQWNTATTELRQKGYLIANVLAALRSEDLLHADDDFARLKAILLEKFLTTIDDGWIFHRAQYYRGAMQAEDETAAGRAILLALLKQDELLEQRYLLVREAVRFIPHDGPNALLTEIRGLSTRLAALDTNFQPLRAKIHVRPQRQDAEAVREYAKQLAQRPELLKLSVELALSIEAAYAQDTLANKLRILAQDLDNTALASELNRLRERLEGALSPAQRFAAIAEFLAFSRQVSSQLAEPSTRLAFLNTSIDAELEAFTAGQAWLAQHSLEAVESVTSRADYLQMLFHAGQASFGTGLLESREWRALQGQFRGLAAANLSLARYLWYVQQLARAPHWASARSEQHFGQVSQQWAAIEPLAKRFTINQVRSSTMLLYSNLLKDLQRDINVLGGVQHDFFGQPVVTGLDALNPGVARGVLRLQATAASSISTEEGIYLVPENLADLPPVTGVLTQSAGNALSNVQLLARNLGIPNVVVGAELQGQLHEYMNKPLLLAVSRGGVVRIEHDQPSLIQQLFEKRISTAAVGIELSSNELALDELSILSTKELRAVDSGRSVGPKAANLAELTRQFPDHVAPALVIPFGVFHQVLQDNHAPDGQRSLFEWMQAEYLQLEALRAQAPTRYRKYRDQFLEDLRASLLAVDFPSGFTQELRSKLHQEFGEPGSYGLFVRSDTNVEDADDFSGAGLNLSVPNVVGFEALLKAIKTVWTGPFTNKAFGWRQSMMEQPAQLYVSVLLQRSVAVERSGVLITADVETRQPGLRTVIAQQGVSTGDERGREALLINPRSGSMELLKSATATHRAVLSLAGGLRYLPVRYQEAVLSRQQLKELLDLADVIHQRIPGLLDQQQRQLAADISFGFVGDRLYIFRVRPYTTSNAVDESAYLNALDEGLRQRQEQPVQLNTAISRSR